MQERKRLESRASATTPAIRSAHRGSRHAFRTRPRRARSVNARHRARNEIASARCWSGVEIGDAAFGRERRPQRHPHHSSRRRRHGEPGLGGNAAAHVPALGGARTLPHSDYGPAGRRRRGHQVRHLRSERRERLRPAAIGDRRAPAGAHFAVRRQRPAAHLVRLRVRVPAGGRRDQDRYPTWTICASTRSAPPARAGSTST